MKKIFVETTISQNEIMKALREITVDDANFNWDEWCERDAKMFETIAKMIRSDKVKAVSE